MKDRVYTWLRYTLSPPSFWFHISNYLGRHILLNNQRQKRHMSTYPYQICGSWIHQTPPWSSTYLYRVLHFPPKWQTLAPMSHIQQRLVGWPAPSVEEGSWSVTRSYPSANLARSLGSSVNTFFPELRAELPGLQETRGHHVYGSWKVDLVCPYYQIARVDSNCYRTCRAASKIKESATGAKQSQLRCFGGRFRVRKRGLRRDLLRREYHCSHVSSSSPRKSSI